MSERRLTLAAAAFFCIACVWLPAQADQASGGSDVDSLFTDSGAPPPPADANAQPPNGSAPAVRPDDLTLDNKTHFFGTLDIYGLFGFGWTGIPDTSNLGGGLDAEASTSTTTGCASSSASAARRWTSWWRR